MSGGYMGGWVGEWWVRGLVLAGIVAVTIAARIVWLFPPHIH